MPEGWMQVLEGLMGALMRLATVREGLRTEKVSSVAMQKDCRLQWVSSMHLMSTKRSVGLFYTRSSAARGRDSHRQGDRP